MISNLLKSFSKSVGDYARAFKSLYDELTAMDRVVKNIDKVHWFLKGLGPKFSIFSTTMLLQVTISTYYDVVRKSESYDIIVKSLKPPTSFVSTFVAQLGQYNSYLL